MIRDELVYRDDLIIRPLRSYSVLSNKKASMYMEFTTINDELIDRCVKNIIEDKKDVLFINNLINAYASGLLTLTEDTYTELSKFCKLTKLTMI